ncbi:hypothetical protein P4U43_15970, partial [Arthrobacter sp. EH-1B-1]|nr:hypothetical protein [Arthrobacter vasquezii]
TVRAVALPALTAAAIAEATVVVVIPIAVQVRVKLTLLPPSPHRLSPLLQRKEDRLKCLSHVE